MIQVKRGSTQKWSGVTLAPGQPGYDKTKNKIKIGDGNTEWSELPYASGLHAEEILCSETDAKANKALNDKFATNIITYGTETPNEDTIGQIYLQQYDEPEVDYVVDAGINGIWTYQKWKSGIAKCWCRLKFTASAQEPFESGVLFHGSGGGGTNYPFTFIDTPAESVTMQGSGGFAWLVNSSTNTKSRSGTYALIAPNSLPSTTCYLSIQVKGFWR